MSIGTGGGHFLGTVNVERQKRNLKENKQNDIKWERINEKMKK